MRSSTIIGKLGKLIRSRNSGTVTLRNIGKTQITGDLNDEKKQNILKYFKRNRSPFLKDEKVRPISYTFDDPVLNKEIFENTTKRNMQSYRMKKDPVYARKVRAQLLMHYQDLDRLNSPSILNN